MAAGPIFLHPLACLKGPADLPEDVAEPVGPLAADRESIHAATENKGFFCAIRDVSVYFRAAGSPLSARAADRMGQDRAFTLPSMTPVSG